MSAFINDEHFRNTLYSWPEIGLVLLYRNFYQKLLAIADMHTGDRQSSEDVLQEVLLDVWKRHKEIGQRHDESIEKYLVKAVRYRSISHYREKIIAVKRETCYYYMLANSESAGGDQPVYASANDHTLMRLIAATFPPREKECLLLKMEGIRNKDIARKLGISVKGVERNLTNARKRFRRFGGAFFRILF